MLKMRTIPEAAAELKAADPHTAITQHAIRQLVLSGRVPHICIGKKRLVNMEELERYLSGGMAAAP